MKIYLLATLIFAVNSAPSCPGISTKMTVTQLKEFACKMDDIYGLTRKLVGSLADDRKCFPKQTIKQELFTYPNGSKDVPIKRTDYQMLLLSRSLYEEVNCRLVKVLSSSKYIKNSGKNTLQNAGQLLVKYCGILQWFDDMIEDYEGKCDRRQQKPKFNKDKYFYDPVKLPDCYDKETKNSEKDHIVLFFKESETLAFALNSVVKQRLDSNGKIEC